MITDRVPWSGAGRQEYLRSDVLATLSLPSHDRLYTLALEVERALSSASTASLKSASSAFMAEAGRFYQVVPPKVRVLATRPLRVHETGSTELFGDYDLVTAVIRIWMRTAVQRRVTSFGTFLSTLCHEFCHHLDVNLLGLPHTLHTRGFYARTAVLYHHCRGTPLRPLVWRRAPQGRWQIDWAHMRRPPTGGAPN